MKNFKMRVYYITGTNKGNLKEELFFDSLEEMEKEFSKLFRYDLYSYNPTLWEYDEKINDYIRIFH